MSDTLRQYQNLTSGSFLQSANGCYQAVMQADGNFCVYQKTNAGMHCPWHSADRARPLGDYFVTMQGDGNLCVYAGTPDKPAGSVWCSMRTIAPPGDCFLVMRNDGNLCVYNGSISKRNLVWQSATADPIQSGTNLSDMVYDLAKATVENNSGQIDGPSFQNYSDIEYPTRGSRTVDVLESTFWTSDTHLTATYFKVSVPIIENGKLEVSAAASYDYVWSNHTPLITAREFKVEARIPAKTKAYAVIPVVRSVLTVPFTVQGIVTYQSGRTYSTTISGTYVGIVMHDYALTFRTWTGRLEQPIRGYLRYQGRSGKEVQVKAH